MPHLLLSSASPLSAAACLAGCLSGRLHVWPAARESFSLRERVGNEGEHVVKRNDITFRCEYSRSLKRLGLHARFRRLLQQLRALKGDSFMDGVRFHVVNPTRRNLFVQTMPLNFPLGDQATDLRRSGSRVG